MGGCKYCYPFYNLSNASTAASAASVALDGLVPVTSLPSVTWNESQTPGGLSSIAKISYECCNFGASSLHLAPSSAAISSTSGSFHDLSVSISFITYSPSVVKPVMVLPLMIDLPVDASMIPPKRAGPWQLQIVSVSQFSNQSSYYDIHR
jgi:hypothetical protein